MQCRILIRPLRFSLWSLKTSKKYGLYQDDCQEWPRKPRLKKTWSNFKTHSARAFKEKRRSSRTSKTKGYATNEQYAQSNAALFTKIHQDHTMALENIATATQSDKTLVVLLTKKIAELTTQVTTLNAKLVTAQSENAHLNIPGHHFANTGAPANHEHRSVNVGAPSDQNTLRDRNVYSRSRQKFDPNRYCSYHGFKVKETHTSAAFR